LPIYVFWYLSARSTESAGNPAVIPHVAATYITRPGKMVVLHGPARPSVFSSIDSESNIVEDFLMKRSHQLSLLAIAIASTAIAGCSSKITQEQLAELQSLRQQEQTMNTQIRQREQDKARLQGEINARRAELDRCNTNRQFVQGKLQQWPDVWPDWKDTPPTPPQPTPTPSRRR
jgi:outer membrane murein-binding lipoprotein Lpp